MKAGRPVNNFMWLKVTCSLRPQWWIISIIDHLHHRSSASPFINIFTYQLDPSSTSSIDIIDFHQHCSRSRNMCVFQICWRVKANHGHPQGLLFRIEVMPWTINNCVRDCVIGTHDVDLASPHRLVVRTSRRGRDNPGSTPGEDISSTFDMCLRHRFALRVLNLDSLAMDSSHIWFLCWIKNNLKHWWQDRDVPKNCNSNAS